MTVFASFCRSSLAGERNLYLLSLLGPSSNGDRLASLQDHMIAENAWQFDLRMKTSN